jgi:hypothetical protein
VGHARRGEDDHPRVVESMGKFEHASLQTISACSMFARRKIRAPCWRSEVMPAFAEAAERSLPRYNSPGVEFGSLLSPAKVLQGAVRLQGLASSPTPETLVRVA